MNFSPRWGEVASEAGWVRGFVFRFRITPSPRPLFGVGEGIGRDEHIQY